MVQRLIVVLVVLLAVPATACAAHGRVVEINQDGPLWDVSCPAATQCTAAGSDGFVTFDPTALAPTASFKLHHTPYAPQPCNTPGCTSSERPSEPGGGQFVSCPTTTQCTAHTRAPFDAQGGMYTSGGSDAVVTFDPRHPGDPNPFSVFGCPGPNASFGSCLRFFPVGLECPAANLCVIAAAKSNSAAGQVLTFDPADPSGTAVYTDVTPGSEFRGLSCAAANRCTAVTAGGGQMTFDPHAPAQAAMFTVTQWMLTDVSCPAIGQCTATANTLNNDTNEAETFDPLDPGSTHAKINGSARKIGSPSTLVVDCPSAHQCTTLLPDVAAGGTFDPTTKGRYPVGEFVAYKSGDTRFPRDLDCPTTRRCVAVGGSATKVHGPATVATFDPTVLLGGVDTPVEAKRKKHCLAKAKKIKNKGKRRKAQRKCRT